ncbi:MAG: hypothetical protein ACQEXJ_08960 [Myxococcota bacterium]
MKLMLDRFYAFLDKPIDMWARVVMVLLLIPLALSFMAPIWSIRMTAPQYPEGLEMWIYSYRLDAGNDGHDIQEINTLNHYVGMRAIDEDDFADLDWIPFGLGFLGILALRAAAIGNIRTLIDITVLTGYLSLFAFGRFVKTLYDYGHDLDPKAPVDMEPFMPVVFGSEQVANFEIHSYPEVGSLWLGIFATGLVVLTLFHLIRGRIRAVRRARAG